MGWIVLLIIIVFIVYYLWISLPIISGYAAKQMATWVFVSGRNEEDVQKTDLGWFPISLAKNVIDRENKTVTSTVFGLAKKKVVFRDRVGATLINSLTEPELQSQNFKIGVHPLPKDESLSWPAGAQIDVRNLDERALRELNSAVDNAFTEPRRNKKQRTRAVVIAYEGKLIAEKYAPGFDRNTRVYGWSMAKSFTSALIGILVKQGKLDIKHPAPIDDWRNTGDIRSKITIEDLLHQMSGLGFTEIYSRASGVTNMLYKADDMGHFASEFKAKNPPNTRFYYSSGNSNILSRIIKQIVSKEDYATFPYRELLYKIGMSSAVFEPDASGMFVGSSYIHATPQDYARFGLLYLNDGVWNGERILPEGWVKASTTAPKSNKLANYGYQFWLNGLKKENQNERVFRDIPSDTFYCHGFGEQSIFIVPSRKLVVVRIGLTMDDSFDENGFLKEIIKSLN